MNKSISCVFFALLIPLLCFADDDNQEYWAITSFSFRLSDTWKMKIKEDFRFRDGDFSEQQNDVFLGCKWSDTLDFGAGFRQVLKEDSSQEWQRENRPYLDLSIKQDLYGLKLSDRNRIEFRDFEDKKDLWRYRNQLKLASPHALFDLPLHPYIADEIFVQEENGYNRNRIYTGLIWDVNKTLDVDFFVINQKDKTSDGWDDLFIAGFEMIFSF